ncbi:MAG: hypothetical protein WCU74_02410 [Candidatus Omnitrophota bacterium]
MKLSQVWGRRLAWACLLIFAAGCGESYPGDKLKESIQAICEKEYGVHDIEIEVAGQTIGVYLPMEKLFNLDFKDILAKGQISSLDKLFEPSPEAFDKIENVLFSISRVLLSTDRKIRFYMMQATDIEKTGQQLVIKGNVDDIRRVRIWDISRGEYRRRVVSEWSYNRPSVWHRPVRKFFRDLEVLAVEDIRKKYFETEVSDEVIQNLFLKRLLTKGEAAGKTLWQFTELKSLPLYKNEIVVTAKVRPVPAGLRGDQKMKAQEEAPELRYLLLVAVQDRKPRLVRVVPFQYLDENGQIRDVKLPSELRFDDKNIQWEQEFKVQEIQYGEFLAEQLTRRVQNLLADDERIRNTFDELKLLFRYVREDGPPFFSVEAQILAKQRKEGEPPALENDEDLLYGVDIALREFTQVIRSYGFEDYVSLVLNFGDDSGAWTFDRDSLELFRTKKSTLGKLLAQAPSA